MGQHLAKALGASLRAHTTLTRASGEYAHPHHFLDLRATHPTHGGRGSEASRGKLPAP